MPSPAFTALATAAARIADLDAALGLMGWDQEVNLAPGSGERRGRQMGTLAALRHRLLSDELKPALARAQDAGAADAFEAKNLAQIAWGLDRALKLPDAFVHELTIATSHAQQAWEQAKRTSDFATFRPHLETILSLKRKEAELYGYAAHPYDALLEGYEPGGTTASIRGLFDALLPPLRELLAWVKTRPQVDDAPLRQPIAEDRQWAYSLAVLRQLGYDFNRGRQDKSTHPFSTGLGMEDVRITTHLQEHDLQAMLYSTIHECGHALYEQGLNPAHYGLPAAEACSLSIHESQSRIWENNVGRGLPFLTHQLSALQELYPDRLAGRTAQDVFRMVNRVEPSLIRIQADELTYHLHILLRFELEVALIGGELSVADLPAAWNERFEALMGVRVPDHAHGCLQDVHWSHGSFGYFPTYTLGSLYAAQLYAAAERNEPDMGAHIAAGDVSGLHDYLQRNVYAHGRLYRSDDLCRLATGEGLNPAYFHRYLRTKLESVYS
jgi:carboxypeptidase Taq